MSVWTQVVDVQAAGRMAALALVGGGLWLLGEPGRWAALIVLAWLVVEVALLAVKAVARIRRLRRGDLGAQAASAEPHEANVPRLQTAGLVVGASAGVAVALLLDRVLAPEQFQQARSAQWVVVVAAMLAVDTHWRPRSWAGVWPWLALIWARRRCCGCGADDGGRGVDPDRPVVLHRAAARRDARQCPSRRHLLGSQAGQSRHRHLPDTHTATELEVKPGRNAWAEQLLDASDVVSVEDDEGTGRDPFRPCPDEKPLGEWPEVQGAYRAWAKRFDPMGYAQHMLDQVAGFHEMELSGWPPFAAALREHRAGLDLSQLVQDNPLMAWRRWLAHRGRTAIPLETFEARRDGWCASAYAHRTETLQGDFEFALWLVGPDGAYCRGCEDTGPDGIGARRYLAGLACVDAQPMCRLPQSWRDEGRAGYAVVSVGIAESYVRQRNRNMRDTLIELSAQGRVAVLIGAAHLPSFQTPDGGTLPGVLDLLRAAGFVVTPKPATVQAAAGAER